VKASGLHHVPRCADWQLPVASAVSVRRVRPDDAPMIDAFVQALSPLSRQRRFHAAVRALPAAWLERMTHPDAQRELALLAIVTLDGRESCIGEARYVLSDDIAVGREFALAVADAWQGRGIGKALLHGLGCHAQRHGVDRLVGDVLRDNLPMIELVRGLGYTLWRHPADARLLRVERMLQGIQADDAAAGGSFARPADARGAAATTPGFN
jgi:acetyltransferase